MKKLSLAACACIFLAGCGLYGTTQYNIRLDAQQADFSRPEDLKWAPPVRF